ncbi:MAG: hypothetical protein JZU60_02465 [Ilumatobacteraceae bacterium]|nr:hypothetical protein [Ilumatobacteraceae bacterium]
MADPALHCAPRQRRMLRQQFSQCVSIRGGLNALQQVGRPRQGRKWRSFVSFGAI